MLINARISLPTLLLSSSLAMLLTLLNVRHKTEKFSGTAGLPLSWYEYADVGPPFGRVSPRVVALDAAFGIAFLFAALYLFEGALLRRLTSLRIGRNPPIRVLSERSCRPSFHPLTAATTALTTSLLTVANTWAGDDTVLSTGFPSQWYRAEFLGVPPYVALSEHHFLLLINIFVCTGLVLLQSALVERFCRRLWPRYSTSA